MGYWKIVKKSATSVDFHISGTIGDPLISNAGKNIEQMINELYDCGPSIKIIDVHINSQGGSMIEGFQIYSMLHIHHALKFVSITGLCGSAATIPAMAGDMISMAANAQFFIHMGKTLCAGGSADLFETAKELEGLENLVLQLYATKTKQDKRKILAMMKKETWMNAAEALEMGFCDEITAPVQVEKPTTTIPMEIYNSNCLHCPFLWKGTNQE